MDKTRLKVWELALLIALCISLCVGTWAQAKQTAISGGLVRLHVIAVSDDDTEQRIKLRVRDEVLDYLSPKLKAAQTAGEAQEIISSELGGIQRAAMLSAEGRAVHVFLDEEYYPTRDYGRFCLPAGRYQSLRVVLGEGKGHNWWCVVFPPLCISAAEQDRALQTMSEDLRGIVAEDGSSVIKFRIVELWGELTKFLGSQ